MSDDLPKETTEIRRLEKQIQNLRCTIGIILLFVTVFFSYMILQILQQQLAAFFIHSLVLPIVVFLLIILLYAWYTTIKE